jgi:hypothetical protein
MRHMFFSRETRNLRMPKGLRSRLQHFACKNVVSHVTFAAHTRMARSRIYGTRQRPEIARCVGLAPFTLMKDGIACNHHRVNTVPGNKNYGKFLVFQSSNMIRAGKFTHAMAMSNTVTFCKWVRKTTKTPYQWHTAMSAPNMVVSGKLSGMCPETVKKHWRATHTSKFPGIAISTDGPCTPEIYNSGAFIIPGVTCVRSLETALAAINEAICEGAKVAEESGASAPSQSPCHGVVQPPIARSDL